MKKVSIIVPIYNAEKFLRECLNSLLNQDYHDYEIIAVNDGSKDGSLSVLECYDGKITIINQENQGVSAARNKGISAAEGDYIVFCDSDDVVEPNYISTLMNCKSTGEALVVAKYRKIYADSSYIENTVGFSGEVLINDKNDSALYELFRRSCLQSPFCKLFKKKIIVENNIQFESSMNFGEDTKFVLDYLKCVGSIYTIEDLIYNYRFNSDSLTNTISKKQVYSFLRLKEYFADFMQFFGLCNSKVDEFYHISTIIDYYNFNLIGFITKDYHDTYRMFKESSIIKKSKQMTARNLRGITNVAVKIDKVIIWVLLSRIKQLRNLIKRWRKNENRYFNVSSCK